MSDDPIPTPHYPTYVAPGELITSEWGNAVVAELVSLGNIVTDITDQQGLVATIGKSMTVYSTNANGDVRVAFGATFRGAPNPPPAVVVSGADANLTYVFTASDVTTTDFNLRARNLADVSPGAITVRVSWIAVGELVTATVRRREASDG